MNALASDTLDKLAADPTAFGSIGPVCFALLVEAARLQVALNECSALLPEGGTLSFYQEDSGWFAWAWMPDAEMPGEWNDIEHVEDRPTPLSAVLALRDALAARR